MSGVRSVRVSLTDEAIARIRTLIQSGTLPPGSKLPPEQQLAAELGISRSPMREAVKALAVARVLDVRRGDGTYDQPRPAVLLEGLGLAVELMQGHTLLELTEVRRLLEPVATGLAPPESPPAGSPRSAATSTRCTPPARTWNCSTSTTPPSTAPWALDR